MIGSNHISGIALAPLISVVAAIQPMAIPIAASLTGTTVFGMLAFSLTQPKGISFFTVYYRPSSSPLITIRHSRPSA